MYAEENGSPVTLLTQAFHLPPQFNTQTVSSSSTTTTNTANITTSSTPITTTPISVSPPTNNANSVFYDQNNYLNSSCFTVNVQPSQPSIGATQISTTFDANELLIGNNGSGNGNNINDIVRGGEVDRAGGEMGMNVGIGMNTNLIKNGVPRSNDNVMINWPNGQNINDLFIGTSATNWLIPQATDNDNGNRNNNNNTSNGVNNHRSHLHEVVDNEQTQRNMQNSIIQKFLTSRNRSLSTSDIQALKLRTDRKIVVSSQPPYNENCNNNNDNSNSNISNDLQQIQQQLLQRQLQLQQQQQGHQSNEIISNDQNNLTNQHQQQQSQFNQFNHSHNNHNNQNHHINNINHNYHHQHNHHHHHQQQHSQLTTRNSAPNLHSVSSHNQKINGFQSRFKINSEKKTQKSMPNMQLCAQVHSSKSNNNNNNSDENNLVNVHPSTPPSSISTPSNNNNSTSQLSSSSFLKPPRRGHMRKRSLSAPITPSPSHQDSNNDHQETIKSSFSSTASTPTSTTPLIQNFPVSISSIGLSSSSPLSFRKPNSLPIQIQRNPKHSQTSPQMSSEEYQRKLNEELEKVDFDDITVSELKDMLRQRGKPATGKKAVLMQRLREEIELVKKNHKNGNNNNNNNNNNGNNDNSSNNNSNDDANNIGNNNNLQYQQMIISPTTPSGNSSLQRCIANLQISSPPRRFSPYVGVPSSPRVIPNNGINNFFGRQINNDNDWQFATMSLVSNHENNNNDHDNGNINNVMIHHNPDLFIQQQPLSAPATTTEFTISPPPSSSTNTATSSPITIDELLFQQQQQQQQLQLQSSTPALDADYIEPFNFINSMTMDTSANNNNNNANAAANATMAINPQMLRLDESSSSMQSSLPDVESIKQEPASCILSNKTSMSSMNGDDSPSSNSSSSLTSLNDPNIIVNTGHHYHQDLAFQYQENIHDQHIMMIKPEDGLGFLNYSSMINTSTQHNDNHYQQQSTQHIPMQIEHQQDVKMAFW